MIGPETAEAMAPEWRFAVTLYGRPGVAQACLALQETCQVDVSFLIAMLYGGLVAGRLIDTAAIAAADATVAEWRSDVVQPLRRTRQQMKQMPARRRPTAAGELREQIKAAELKAEQIELMELAEWIAELPANAGRQPDAEAVAALVVNHFGGADAAAEPVTAGHIAAIAAAAERVAAEQVPA